MEHRDGDRIEADMEEHCGHQEPSVAAQEAQQHEQRCADMEDDCGDPFPRAQKGLPPAQGIEGIELGSDGGGLFGMFPA